MSKKDWYVITDLKKFIDSTRALVFNNFGNSDKDDNSEEIELISVSDNEQEEFNQVLSYNESYIIAKELLKKQKNKVTKKIRYLVSDVIYENYITALNQRMTANILRNLVSKGLIETAFDSECNDFVFWVKEENETDQNNK